MDELYVFCNNGKLKFSQKQSGMAYNKYMFKQLTPINNKDVGSHRDTINYHSKEMTKNVDMQQIAHSRRKYVFKQYKFY